MDAPRAGELLRTAMVSPMTAGRARIWMDSGPLTVELHRPAELGELLGVGLLARMTREEHRTREVVAVSEDFSTLQLLPRLTEAMMRGDEPLGVRTVAVAAVPDPGPASTDEWRAFADWLTDVLRSASARGELIVVERGGVEFQDEPYALGVVRRLEDGSDEILLEVAPRPPATPSWPDGSDPRGQTIQAPLLPTTLAAAGPLLAEAIRTWATSPLDLAITFAFTGAEPIDTTTVG